MRTSLAVKLAPSSSNQDRGTTWKNRYKILIALVACLLCWTASTAHAQSPPTDLTELDIEEILMLHIIRQDTLSRWSVGYRYIQAKFDGNRNGTQDLSVEEASFRPGTEARTTDNFPVVPETIRQQAHLIEITFRPTPKLSISLQIPYILQQTDHVSSIIREVDGVVYDFSEFKIESSGPGDVVASITYPVWRKGSHHILSTMGISIPTGSIDKVGATPRVPGQDTQLPFTMQLGSGTYDFVPGLTYAGKNRQLRWGVQVRNVFRLGKNDRDYGLGNLHALTGWLKTKLTPWLEPSITLTFQTWGRIDGDDEDLKIESLPVSPYPAAVTDPDKFGGEKVNVLFGATFSRSSGPLKRHTLQIEAAYRFINRLTVQPKEIWRFGTSWNWSF